VVGSGKRSGSTETRLLIYPVGQSAFGEGTIVSTRLSQHAIRTEPIFGLLALQPAVPLVIGLSLVQSVQAIVYNELFCFKIGSSVFQELPFYFGLSVIPTRSLQSIRRFQVQELQLLRLQLCIQV
jgi:hypothetical protein